MFKTTRLLNQFHSVLLCLLLHLFFASKVYAQTPVLTEHNALTHLNILDSTRFKAILDKNDFFVRYSIFNQSQDTLTDVYYGLYGQSECNYGILKGEPNYANLQNGAKLFTVIPGSNFVHDVGVMDFANFSQSPGDTVYLYDHLFDSLLVEFTLDSVQIDLIVQGQTHLIDLILDIHDLNSVKIGSDIWTVLIEELNFPYTLPDTSIVPFEATQPAVYKNGQRTAFDEQTWRACTPKQSTLTNGKYVAMHYNRLSQIRLTPNGFEFAVSFRAPGGIGHYTFNTSTEELTLLRTVGELDTAYMLPQLADSLKYVNWIDSAEAFILNHGADFIKIGDTTYYSTYNNNASAAGLKATFDIIAVNGPNAHLRTRVQSGNCSQRVGDSQIHLGSDGKPYFSFVRGFEGLCSPGFQAFTNLPDSVSENYSEVVFFDINGIEIANFNSPRYKQGNHNSFYGFQQQIFDSIEVLIDVSNGLTYLQNNDVDYWVNDVDTTWGTNYTYPYAIAGLCELEDSVRAIHEAKFFNHRIVFYHSPSFVGLDENNHIELAPKIAPNPFRDFVHFELIKNSHVALFGLNGELVFSRDFHSGKQKLNTAKLPSGYYHCRISEYSTNSTYHYKLIKL